MIWDAMAGSGNALFGELVKQATLPYLQRNATDFNISPAEMVRRLQIFIDPELHIETPPSSVASDGRGKSAGAGLVHRAFTAGSNLVRKSRGQASQRLTIYLSVKLEALKVDMITDNDYRDACIRVWRANGANLGEIDVQVTGRLTASS
jgi:hypothetical protein